MQFFLLTLLPYSDKITLEKGKFCQLQLYN